MSLSKCSSSARGDAQFSRWPEILAADTVLERDDLIAHAFGERDHLFAPDRRHVAATLALEQARAELLLDLAEASEDGGVIDAESLGRTRQRTRVGDRLDVAEIVP